MMPDLTADEQHELLTKVREIHAAMLARRHTASSSVPTPRATSAAPASAKPVQSELRDPPVRFDPKRGYTGTSMVGRRLSECPPLYLGALSHLYDWRVKKNRDEGNEAWADADEQMAALCRAWRERLEGAAKAAAPTGGLFAQRPMSDDEMNEAF